MAIFAKKNPIEKLRGEIAALEARRAALAEQRTAAAVALDAARGLARDALIAGDNSFDDAAVVSAERRLAAIDDALAEIGRRIEDAGAALAEQEDTAAREAEAAARERAAAKIEAIAVRLDRAIGDVAAISRELRDAIPSALDVRRYDQLFGDTGGLDAQQVVNATLAEGLFSSAPELFEVETDRIGGLFSDVVVRLHRRLDDGSVAARCLQGQMNSFLPASGAVETTIVAPLRDSAALIRAGELPADAPATPTPQRPELTEAAE